LPGAFTGAGIDEVIRFEQLTRRYPKGNIMAGASAGGSLASSILAGGCTINANNDEYPAI